SIGFKSTSWSNLPRDPLVWHAACEVSGNLVAARRTCGCGSTQTDGGSLMKSSTALVTALFAVASFPLLAQQPPPTSSPATPPTQQNPPEAAPPASSAASQEASASPAVAM